MRRFYSSVVTFYLSCSTSRLSFSTLSAKQTLYSFWRLRISIALSCFLCFYSVSVTCFCSSSTYCSSSSFSCLIKFIFNSAAFLSFIYLTSLQLSYCMLLRSPSLRSAKKLLTSTFSRSTTEYCSVVISFSSISLRQRGQAVERLSDCVRQGEW